MIHCGDLPLENVFTPGTWGPYSRRTGTKSTTSNPGYRWFLQGVGSYVTSSTLPISLSHLRCDYIKSPSALFCLMDVRRGDSPVIDASNQWCQQQNVGEIYRQDHPARGASEYLHLQLGQTPSGSPTEMTRSYLEGRTRPTNIPSDRGTGTAKTSSPR